MYQFHNTPSDRQISDNFRNAFSGGTLLFEHRPALMSDQQVVHVVRVLFLLRQNPLEQHARGHILVAEMAHHIPVRLDGDALGNQIFFDHVDQVLTLDILRGRAGDDTVRIEVWLTAELIDPATESPRECNG
jgi:hypothetical protein